MFEKVIVLGRGKTALGCARFLLEQGVETQIRCVDGAVGSMRAQVKSLLGEDAARELFWEKDEATSRLLAETRPTLLVSAVNSYLIPKRVLEKRNICAVNFHNAYLPRHPGRNAEAWTIFERDAFAGVTWHYVVAAVDAGRIIAQSKLPLTEKTTSLSLLQEQNDAALRMFREIFPAVWAQTCVGTEQRGEPGRLRYSWERPGDGVLDLGWDGEKISAFLRCYDYGILRTLGDPAVDFGGKRFSWKKYAVEPCPCGEDAAEMEGDCLVIRRAGLEIRLMRLFEIQQEGTV